MQSTLRLAFYWCLTALLLSASTFAQSSASATQTLVLEVRSVAAISVTGDPQPLTITDGTAGSVDLQVQDNSTAYRLTTNSGSKKLAVSLDSPMPQGTRLLVNFESTAGTSLGTVDVSAGDLPIDVVKDIHSGIDADQRISYRFEANAGIGSLAPTSRTVVLTLTD